MVADLLAHRTRGHITKSENTIESMLALGAWVKGVEVDPRLSLDDVPVLMHDDTVDRTTDGTGQVNELTAAQITALFVDQGVSGNGNVPTLEAYLDACSGRGFHWIYLDAKLIDVTSLAIMQAVVDAAPADVRSAVVWLCASDTAVQNVRAVSSTVRIGRRGATTSNVQAIIDVMNQHNGTIITTNPDSFTGNESLVDTVHQAGFFFGTGRSNDDLEIIAARDAGADVVSTDNSDLFPTWIEDQQPDPEPEPPPVTTPQRATAVIRRAVTWLACDLATGGVIYEVPEITGNIERLICEASSTGLTLPIPRSGPGALPMSIVDRVTAKGRSMIVAVLNDIPTWAGIVIGPTESGTDATVTMPCVTLEGYLDRRFVRDHTWTNQDVGSVIAPGLLADAGDIAGVGSGIGLMVDAPATGITMSREYLATDHRSVLTALQELSTVENGIEFTIDVDWEDASARNRIIKVFRVRSRLGVGAATPNAVFQTTARSLFQAQGAAEARYTYREDYSTGRGANYVIAYSSGQGDDQPTSAPAIAQDLLDAGFPIYEQHYQPDTDIEDTAVLDEHARAELERRQNGVTSFNVEARWDAYPRYGVDWQIGDDVAWSVIGHRHPHGVVGQGRAIGFTLDMQRQVIRPILRENA